MANFESSESANFQLNTLSQTLVNGDQSGTNSIVITPGTGLVGLDSVGPGAAGSVPISGGDNTGGSAGDDGGLLVFTGGNAIAGLGGGISILGGTGNAKGVVQITGTNSTGTGQDGGDVTLSGGSTAGSSSGSAGNIFLIGPQPPSFNGTGGSLSLFAGNGASGGGDGDGGGITATTGSATLLGNAGSFLLSVGATTTSNTGVLGLTGGTNSGGSGTGGVIDILGGSGPQGGAISIKGGASLGGPGVGGNVDILSGTSATGGNSGNVTVAAADVTLSEASVGGNATLKGGNSGTTGVGGKALVRGGDSNSATERGGVAEIVGGNNLNAGSGDGGNVLLTPGQASGTGNEGLVQITKGVLEFIEQSTVTGNAIDPTQGRIWVRDDSPNVLVFTDDTGVDTVISVIRSLAVTLGIGNTTGGNDIVISDNDTLEPANDLQVDIGTITKGFNTIYVDKEIMEVASKTSDTSQTIGAVQSVLSNVQTLAIDGNVASIVVDIVGSSTTLGSALTQQLHMTFFRNVTVQNLANVVDNTDYVGTLSTSSATLSINGDNIDLVFTGEGGHTINWAAKWEITHNA